MTKFLAFNHSMIVSGEVNLWPNPHLAPYLPSHCTRDGKCGRYKFPNSGGYMGYLDYILDLYTDKIAIHHKVFSLCQFMSTVLFHNFNG